MSDEHRETRRLNSLPATIVRESKMPPYRYQVASGGSGSLSSKTPAEIEERVAALRSLNLNLKIA